MTKFIRRSAFALCLLAGGLRGWGQTPGVDTERFLTVGGIARSYWLHVPAPRPTNAALVLVFHGGGGQAQGMRAITAMNRVADQHGFVVAYPQGLGRVWNDGGSDLGQTPPRDDVAFVRQLVVAIAPQASIDTNRVFACGFSNGGALTARLALEASDLIAAGAMVGSGLYLKQQQAHPNPPPLPVLFIEGTDDPCHPYNGGEAIGPRIGGIYKGEPHGLCLASDAVISFWRKVNGCADEPAVTGLPHKTSDRTSTTCQRWMGKNGNDVELYIVHGGGHCWPGGLQYFPVSVIGKTTYDFAASEVIWRFFENHPRHQPAP